MFANEPYQPILIEIQSARVRILERMLADLYHNPFWDARFGEKGRIYAVQDSGYHIDYLLTAIKANDPQVYGAYWAWFRPLMVQRGICTRHLVDTLTSLGQHLIAEVAQDDRLLAVYLGAARQALDYDLPACRELAALENQIVKDVLVRAGPFSPQNPSHPSTETEILYVLSYLQDGAISENPEILKNYLHWGSAQPSGMGVQYVSSPRVLQILFELLRNSLSPASMVVFEPVLALV